MTIDINGNPVIGVELNGTPISNVDVGGQNVWEEAFFDVQNISAPNETNEGNSFTVSADIVNTGDGSDAQSINFNRGGSTTVSLNSNQNTNVSFSETINNAGSYTLTISSDDDSASRTIDIIDPRFDVTKVQFDTTANTPFSSPSGFAWNDDGTQAYVTDYDSDRLYQGTVSTPYDITSISFNTSIDVEDEDSIPRDITWNDDGTKMFIVGNRFERIISYNVSTPYDITSSQVENVYPTENADPTGMAWSDDGTKMHEVGYNRFFIGRVAQHDLSTPYDIGSASFSGKFRTPGSPQDEKPTDIAWNDDGTRFYVTEREFSKIYQYSTSTPYDVLSNSRSLEATINAPDQYPQDIEWNNDGSRMYVIGQFGDGNFDGTDTLYQFTI